MSSYTSNLWAFFGFEVEKRTPPGADELDKAYRAEALKSHPDKHPEDPVAATSRFQFVKKAYDELKELLATGAIKNAAAEESASRQPEHRSDGCCPGCDNYCWGDTPLKGREAKEAEKKKRQAENLKAQAEARRKKCAKVKEQNREMRALQALRDELDSSGKKSYGDKHGGQSSGQETNNQHLAINIAEVNNKVLALTLKQHKRDQNLRPSLNCGYSDGNVDAEKVKPDVEASVAAEKEDLDFWSSAALDESANPYLLFEGENSLARQSMNFQSDKERKAKNPQAVENGLNDLLAARDTFEKKASQPKPKPRKPQTYADILKNGKADTDNNASKHAAAAWTTQHLEDLQQEKIAVIRKMEEAGTDLIPYSFGQLERHGKEITPNINLSLSHYIDPKVRHVNWKQAIQQYAYADVDQEELELSRGVGFEHRGKHFAYTSAFFEAHD